MEVLTGKVPSFLQVHIPIIQVLTRKINLLQQHIPVVKVLMRIFLILFSLTFLYVDDNNNNTNNLFYIAPQQQLYELLALYRSTNAIEHTSICYLN